MMYFFTARVRSTREGNVLTPVCVSVHTFGGGSQVQVGGSQVSDFQGGGVPGFRFWEGGPRSQIFGGGGSQVSDFGGGPRSQILGGVPSLRFWGGGGTWSQ